MNKIGNCLTNIAICYKIIVKYDNFGGVFMKAKKILAVLLSIIMVCAAAVLPVEAAQISESAAGAAAVAKSGETSGDYKYEVNDDGTVTITGYTGSPTELTIPSEIDGKSVKRIA